MNSLPKTVTRQRRGCDLNPGSSAPESSTLGPPLSFQQELRSVDALVQSAHQTSGKVSLLA